MGYGIQGAAGTPSKRRADAHGGYRTFMSGSEYDQLGFHVFRTVRFTLRLPEYRVNRNQLDATDEASVASNWFFSVFRSRIGRRPRTVGPGIHPRRTPANAGP